MDEAARPKPAHHCARDEDARLLPVRGTNALLAFAPPGILRGASRDDLEDGRHSADLVPRIAGAGFSSAIGSAFPIRTVIQRRNAGGGFGGPLPHLAAPLRRGRHPAGGLPPERIARKRSLHKCALTSTSFRQGSANVGGVQQRINRGFSIGAALESFASFTRNLIRSGTR